MFNQFKTTSKKISGLKKSAYKSLTMFSKALRDLEKVNAKIESELEKAETQRLELLSFSEQLASEKTINATVIEKIKSIIS